MKKIKIGIIGSSGYTASELLRLIANHPKLALDFAYSHSHAGKSFADLYSDLEWMYPGYRFSGEINKGVDVVFLCLGHGEAALFLKQHRFADHTLVIDLSQDHRLDHSDFVYGLSEINRHEIAKAQKIANPGCFATAIELALYPFVAELPAEVHITALTGSTGAGVRPSDTSHFSWRQNNISVYKAFSHQHLHEISALLAYQSWQGRLNFIPMRGCFARGILASIYFYSDLSFEAARSLLSDFYKDGSFVHIREREPDLKSVINTNHCQLSLQKHGDYLHIVSVIDNLIKGASGQALQNLNLMMGWPEDLGLTLKPIAY
ncbi:MAG: N-acetyl-gamma-glutamyl-phosphate reductase [Francisellaceae bacterium]